MDPVSDAVAHSIPAEDIRFSCQHCQSALIVAAAAAGMTVTCQQCQQGTIVPAPAATTAPMPSLSFADLTRRLKENESQRTEVTSYINQLAIQLHRWKIRLQTLNERKAELEAQVGSFEK